MPHWPCFSKSKRAAEQFFAGAVDEAVRDVAGKLRAVALRQFRLRIGQIDVARPAVHEQRDHRLGPRANWDVCGFMSVAMRALRISGGAPSRFSSFSSHANATAADAHCVALQKAAAGECRGAFRKNDTFFITGRARCSTRAAWQAFEKWHWPFGHVKNSAGASLSIEVQEFVGAQEHLAQVHQRLEVRVNGVRLLIARLCLARRSSSTAACASISRLEPVGENACGRAKAPTAWCSGFRAPASPAQPVFGGRFGRGAEPPSESSQRAAPPRGGSGRERARYRPYPGFCSSAPSLPSTT